MADSAVQPIQPELPILQKGLDPNGVIKTYFSDPDWRYKTFLGGFFNSAAMFMLCLHTVLIPLSFCFWALTVGYTLRVCRERLKSDVGELPKWNDYQDLFISGLTWLAVFTGQIVFILSACSVALLVGAGLGATYALSKGFLIWAGLTVGVVSSIWLSTSFLSCLAMTNFAEKESTGAAFAVFIMLRNFQREPLTFIQAWLLAIGLHAIAFILPTISIVGIFFTPMTLFLAGNLSAHLFAQAWSQAQANEPTKISVA